jgi:hypothetical protein
MQFKTKRQPGIQTSLVKITGGQRVMNAKRQVILWLALCSTT